MTLPERPPSAQAGAGDSAAMLAWRLWLAAAEQSARLAEAQSELRRLRDSKSWRLTAPLRAFARAVRGDRRAAPPHLQAPQPAGEATRRASPGSAEFKRAFDGQGGRKLFVDVTALAIADQGAGIQRVTRRLLAELLLSPPGSTDILPVRLADDGEYWIAYPFLAEFLGLPRDAGGGEKRVVAAKGDVFLGLDFVREYAGPAHGAWRRLREQGAALVVVAYDVLPLRHPEWFPQSVPEQYAEWLEVVSDCADHVASISAATADAFAAELRSRGKPLPPRGISVFPMGCDGFVGPARETLPGDAGREKRVLMVGTIEPRKGHAQALAAFERMWSRGDRIELVIAGREGWDMSEWMRSLRAHAELGRRLHFLESPDDAVLAGLYRTCDLLLMASRGEGFGLPVVEGACRGIDLMLRDLPVFREVAGDGARYFSGDEPEALADALEGWRRGGETARGSRLPAVWPSWADSAKELARTIFHNADAGSTERGGAVVAKEPE